VAIRSRWTVIVEPTNMQVAAERYELEHGRPMPGATPETLGYLWQLHNIVTMQVDAAGHEATADQAEAAAVRRVESLLDADSARVWLDEMRHQRAGRVDLADLIAEDC
jgi:hypothetical protein